MSIKILGRSGVHLTAAGSSPDDLSAEFRKIVNLSDPIDPSDAATKAYVDTASNALDGSFRIKNTLDETKELAFDVSAVAASTTRTIIMPNSNVNLGLIATAIQSSEKGAANGVVPLNSSSKIDSSYLPALAITDVFVVADIAARNALPIGTGDGEVQEGDVAIVNDAGTGEPNSYIYTGSFWQEILKPTSAVLSVNGQVGIVSLDSDNIPEGSTNLYYTSARFDVDFSGKSTSDLSEGANLYFTSARVLTTTLTGFVASTDTAIAATDTILEAFQKAQAQITVAKDAAAAAELAASSALSDVSAHLSSTSGAHTAQAISSVPLGNLLASNVQDALDELQSDVDSKASALDLQSHITATSGAHQASAISYDNSSSGLTGADTQAAIDEVTTRLQSVEADYGATWESGVLGEDMGADQVWLVRRAKDGETIGRYYKAQADSAINSRVVGFVVALDSTLLAGSTVRVYKLGTAVLGLSDSAFLSAQANYTVFLSQTLAGKWTVAPSEVANHWIKEIGFVADTGIIEFQPGVLIRT